MALKDPIHYLDPSIATDTERRQTDALEQIAAQSVLIKQHLMQIGAALTRLGALSASR